jgi:hypothetical protein
MARGKHLFPFRTEQLSPSAPMVLGPKGPGRVGRRRFLLRAPVASCGWGSWCFWARFDGRRSQGTGAAVDAGFGRRQGEPWRGQVSDWWPVRPLERPGPVRAVVPTGVRTRAGSGPVGCEPACDPRVGRRRGSGPVHVRAVVRPRGWGAGGGAARQVRAGVRPGVGVRAGSGEMHACERGLADPSRRVREARNGRRCGCSVGVCASASRGSRAGRGCPGAPLCAGVGRSTASARARSVSPALRAVRRGNMCSVSYPRCWMEHPGGSGAG